LAKVEKRSGVSEAQGSPFQKESIFYYSDEVIRKAKATRGAKRGAFLVADQKKTKLCWVLLNEKLGRKLGSSLMVGVSPTSILKTGDTSSVHTSVKSLTGSRAISVTSMMLIDGSI